MLLLCKQEQNEEAIATNHDITSMGVAAHNYELSSCNCLIVTCWHIFHGIVFYADDKSAESNVIKTLTHSQFKIIDKQFQAFLE